VRPVGDVSPIGSATVYSSFFCGSLIFIISAFSSLMWGHFPRNLRFGVSYNCRGVNVQCFI
jgi:hypothetical protein